MISVDTVYQTVLALANKEQRGYITPQEFNLYAEHAQMSIFEQYFYDINQFKRIPGNDSDYADVVGLIEEKLSIFKMGPTEVTNNNELSDIASGTQGVFHRLGEVFLSQSNSNGLTMYNDASVVEEINQQDVIKIQSAPLTRATNSRPMYFLNTNILTGTNDSSATINFIPQVAPSNGSYQVFWMRRPFIPKWTYIVVDEKPLYFSNAPDHQDFELHPSDQNELVIKILQLAGVTLKDYNLVQAAGAEEAKNIQQEKQ